jgi:hypothetical protein
MRRSRIAGILLVAFAAAACGPLDPLSVGTQDVPLSLILGEHQAVQTAPVGPLTLPPSVPGSPVFGPPAPAPTTSPTRVSTTPPQTSPVVQLGACPDYSPIAPVLGVTTSVVEPPAAATYTYRAHVTEQTGAVESHYSGPTTWTVSPPSKPDSLGDYTFAIRVRAGSQLTVTTYEVVPTGVEIDGQPVPPDLLGTTNAVIATVNANTGENIPEVSGDPAPLGQPGLFLAGVAGTGQTTFQPKSPLQLVAFPVTLGAAFSTAGSDGTTTMSYTSTVAKQVKDNACGVPVQAWDISLTGGRLLTEDSSGSPQDVSFTRELDVATQFGGLIVGDDSSITGTTVPNVAVNLTKVFTIDRLPRTGRPLS